MKNLRTIVLAAGKGTRMKSAVPKILHPVCGKPMLAHVLDTVRKAGSLKTYVVLGHQRDRVRKGLDLGRDVTTVLQKKLLGTADAVRSVRGHLRGYRGDVLILCGDTPLLKPATLRKLVRAHKKTKAACTVLTAMLDDPRGYGRIVRDPEGNVLAIREEKDATRDEKEIPEINVGVYCFKVRALLDHLKRIKLNRRKKEFYLTDIIALMADKGQRILSVETADPAEGLGINDRVDLAAAEWLMRRDILEKLMLNGVTIEDPATTYVAAEVTIGRDTVIRPGTVIETDVRIGNGCRIGPFARIRPGSRIGARAEVGNFTEVSRATVGEGTLMKHFGFVGDARIGRNVNIGAGTVTANFDGKNKNLTRISDGAFIGSDSVLVAPVGIGKKAVTGAGCVVKKGSVIPAGSTAAGVPAKIIRRRS